MNADLDETARLVLMDDPSGVREFVASLRAVHPEASLVDVAELWRKYRGLDGRVFATHDIATGLPIRRNT